MIRPSQLITLYAVTGLVLIGIRATHGGSATWNATPNSGYWRDSSNWTPATVPQASTDTATFATSSITTVTDMYLTVGSIVFNPGASAYTFSPYEVYKSAMIGPGFINNSSSLQTINLTAVPTGSGDEEWGTNEFNLFSNATAGTMIRYNVYGSSCADGKTDDAAQITFYNETTAGAATFVTYPGLKGYYDCHGQAGSVIFADSSSAAQATFFNNGATIKEGHAGYVDFSETSTAANAIINNDAGSVAGASGAVTYIFDTATAGNATLIANGGVGDGGLIQFSEDATGGTARVEVFGNGNLDISFHNSPGVTIGSLEGDGAVFLGKLNLTVGSSNTKTVFSGTIQNGGGGNGGSLTKIGTGNLNLSGANTYSGGTTLNGGTLLVTNTSGSGLGTGPVQALTGILGGTGIISGRVTMGTGLGTGVTLGPGANSVLPGTLTIGKQLALKSDATYLVTVKSSTPAADLVVANGIRIIRAQIVFNEVSSAVLPPGTMLTVIGNISSKPISGTFANLPDGGTVTIGSNTFQANYEGGDGNDLTLTVMP